MGQTSGGPVYPDEARREPQSDAWKRVKHVGHCRASDVFPRRSEPPHLWQVPDTAPDPFRESSLVPSDDVLVDADLLLFDLRAPIEFECTPRCGADSTMIRGRNRRRRLTGRVEPRCGSSVCATGHPRSVVKKKRIYFGAQLTRAVGRLSSLRLLCRTC